MKKMEKLLIIIILLNVKFSNAQSFMGIDIDGSQENIKLKLLNKGFKLVETRSNIYYYSGKFNENKISLLVNSTPKTKKVYRFFISYDDVIDSWGSVNSEFDKHNRILINKYGEPFKEIKKYEYPYTEGDGYELGALESGKLNFYNMWYKVGENKNLSLILTATKSKRISFLYLNVKNLELYENEQAELDKDAY
jgi:hypothetical protein